MGEQSHASQEAGETQKRLGFWSCWSLTVGIMIGSGVFLLPSVLAPYGLMSFGGWVLTGAGSICLALVFARLAARTSRSGGVYAYAKDAFGDLPGFLIAWGYWASYWIAMPAMAIAFVGYLGVFFPALNDAPLYQALTALALIWTLVIVNVQGVREASLVQLVMTLLKLVPLLVIIALGAFAGAPENLPAVNPSDGALLPVLATTALLTMWAFSGMEAGAIPAGDVKDAERTIPRAIVIGVLTVAFVYIAATAAVMALVPADVLETSTSPFADAAKKLGVWGPPLVAVGAMISTAGALNGSLFVAGQMPMAVAIDRLAPRIFTRKNKGGAPVASLLFSAVLASLLLLANYSRGLIGAFTFLALMSTLTIMTPMLVSAAAELRYSWKSAKGWAAIALLALIYSVFAIIGSGLEVIVWGVLLLAIGVPVYYRGRQA